jgi:hypothetical protein
MTTMITLELTDAEARELSVALWDWCSDCDGDVQYLREELPLADVWRRLIAARHSAAGYTGDIHEGDV